VSAWLGVLLAGAALAQSPQPYMAPDASSATATDAGAPPPTVAASTETAVLTSSGASVAGAEKPSLTRPIHAVIHKDAASWEPVSLLVGGDPGAMRTRAVLRARRTKKGKVVGDLTHATASARVHPTGDDRWLVISVFPRALARRRKHFEIRFRIVEGYVEEAKAALVTVVDQRRRAGEGLDSAELTRKGIEYGEEFPDSGALVVSALDGRPSSEALNVGSLRRAYFADLEAGLAEVTWSVKGLPPLR
jgi:hypothetical protein